YPEPAIGVGQQGARRRACGARSLRHRQDDVVEAVVTRPHTIQPSLRGHPQRTIRSLCNAPDLITGETVPLLRIVRPLAEATVALVVDNQATGESPHPDAIVAIDVQGIDLVRRERI